MSKFFIDGYIDLLKETGNLEPQKSAVLTEPSKIQTAPAAPAPISTASQNNIVYIAIQDNSTTLIQQEMVKLKEQHNIAIASEKARTTVMQETMQRQVEEQNKRIQALEEALTKNLADNPTPPGGINTYSPYSLVGSEESFEHIEVPPLGDSALNSSPQ